MTEDPSDQPFSPEPETSGQRIEEIASVRTDLRRLLRHVVNFRENVVSAFGVDAPESASLLIDALDRTNDAGSRLSLYQGAITECLIKGCFTAAERIAVAAHEEHRDILSLMVLSQTLTDVGKPSEGLAYANAALAQAMSDKIYVNFAAGNLMRRAIETGSVEAVNEALDALVDSTQVPRSSDCALETDWIDAANALGADKELTDWVRAVADRKRE